MSLMIFAAVIGAVGVEPEEPIYCDKFVGQFVSPRDIDDVMQPFRNVGPKGEFESTKNYESRKAVAVATLRNSEIISKEPEDRKRLVYDADTQQLHIISYAFRNLGFNSDALFGYDAPYRGLVEHGLTNIEVVIKEENEVTGTYSASNAYGAKVQVAKVLRRTRGIYEGKANFSEPSIFPAADQKPYVAGSIFMNPNVARSLKPSIQLAFVMNPKAPYYLKALYKYPSRPTVTNPQEVTNEVSALIGDIKCGLVLDPQNKVLGSFPTR